MKQIGVKNFRRFEQLDPIPFGNITILVGPNNSGKSTIVKAFYLIMNYIKSGQVGELPFSGPGLNELGITNFGRAKTIGAKEPLEFTLLYDEFEFRVVADADDSDMTYAKVTSLSLKDSLRGLQFNLSLVSGIEFVVSKTKPENTGFVKEDPVILALKKEINQLRNQLAHESNLSPKEKLLLVDKAQGLEDKLKGASGNETVKQASFDYRVELFYDFFGILNRTDGTENEKTEYDVNADVSQLGAMRSLEFIITYFHEEAKRFEAKESGLDYVDGKYVRMEDPALFNEDAGQATEEAGEVDEPKEELTKASLDTVKFANDESVLESLQSFEYLFNSHGTYHFGKPNLKQSTIYVAADKSNALSAVISEYYSRSIQSGQKAHRFLIKWMKEFEIGEAFTISPYDGGEAFGLKITRGGKVVHLADMGSGGSQLMFLLFQIALVIDDLDRIESRTKGDVSVLLEEPEMNIHPKLQSKLADLFHETHNEYWIDFIVETHSEYLIRRAQLLVRSNDYALEAAENPFFVSYCPGEGNPYHLQFEETGKFNRSFGPGFFDVADDAAMELYRLNKTTK